MTLPHELAVAPSDFQPPSAQPGRNVFAAAHAVRTVFATAVLSLFMLCESSAFAQTPATPGLLANAAGYSAVSIQPEVRPEPGPAGPMSNMVFKPAGEGPFPAVVLVHSCAGIGPAHIRTHANEMLGAGYVVLVLDSHGPRGFETCRQKMIPFAVGVMDAYAGLKHLTALPFVNKDRIYLGGYSYGGSVASLLASPQSAVVFGSPFRFRATVAHYSNCIRPSGAKIVLPDTDRPLLVLMGDADTESPPASCFPLLEEMRVSDVPVSWHLYPGQTHGWDRQDASRNGYVYNEAASLDATRRMAAFFEANK